MPLKKVTGLVIIGATIGMIVGIIAINYGVRGAAIPSVIFRFYGQFVERFQFFVRMS